MFQTLLRTAFGCVIYFAQLLPIFAQSPCDCIGAGNCPVNIVDNGQTVIELPVNMPDNPDLSSCPLESVCITISHTWIGDISVSLESPNGEHYLIMADVGNNYGECGTQQDNMEICIVVGNNKPLTNNNDYQCNPAPCSLGTCCLNGNWTVPCGGVTSPITDAIQAPHCDLNDFNLPGAPTNGVWKLVVLDVCNMDLGVIHNASLNFACSNNTGESSCAADGGVLGMDDIVYCGSNQLDINPWYCGATAPGLGFSYSYAIAQNDAILSFMPTVDPTGFALGQYEVWGFSYANAAAGELTSLVGNSLQATKALFDSNAAPFCGDFSVDGFNILVIDLPSVNAGPDLVLDCWQTSYQLTPLQFPNSDLISYNWTLPSNQIINGQATITAESSGDYVFSIVDSTSGCTISDTLGLTIPLPLIANIAVQTASCDQADGMASVVLQPSVSNANYAWSNGATTQTNMGLAQGSYSVTVSDAYCSYHQNFYVDEDRSCKVTIQGRIINDGENGDCQTDLFSLSVECIMLHLMPADIYTYSIADGSFEFVVDAGDYTIEYVDEDLYEVVCPSNGTIQVSLPNDGSLSTENNFYVKKVPQPNLCISMNNGPARPGFTQTYHFQYCNIGTMPIDATITFVHDSLLEQSSLGTVLPNGYDPATNTATWTIEDIPAGACQHVYYYLQVPASVPIGTPLSGSIRIDPVANDPYPQNNFVDWTQVVVGSYDPNEKSTQTGENQWGGLILEEDSILHYQVLFQNTGTDTAFTVVVRDTLDADLNVETIRPGMASHPYRLEFEGNNVLVFNFRDIMLPDSNRNEPASHGAVTFSIKRKPGLAIGEEIHNRAAIFFDYNTPIITNTTTHTLGKYLVYTQNSVTLCNGEALNGTVYEADTALIATYSYATYDSIVTTQIDVLPIVANTISTAICDGSSYFFNGQNLTTPGLYMVVLTAANGCDSTVTLNLGVGPFISTSFHASICEGESYNFDGQNLTVAGNYQSTYTALGGCDSTSTLNLIVLQNIESQVSAAICPGESYPFNGQNPTEPGTYQATLTAANGCDSTVKLTLILLENTASEVSATICSGESYPFNGQNPTAPGIYQSVLTAANGCDSTVTLTLSVLPNFVTPLSASICEGETFPFNGQGFTTAGVYQWVLMAINGCDSTVTLTLEVLPNLERNLDVQICAGVSYIFGDQIITVSGVYEGVFAAANGCDSTVTLTLNVVPAIVESLSAAICQGDSYAFGGSLLTQSGDYAHTAIAAGGCDSTTLLHLVVKPEFVTNLQVELVEGDLWNGVPIFNNTTIEEHYTASNGCDSAVFVQITVLSDTRNPLGQSYDLLIFPNPFDASTTIELKGVEPGKSVTFKLLDVTGRLVQQRTFRSPSFVFHRENLPSGLYFIKVETEDGRPVAVGRVVAK